MGFRWAFLGSRSGGRGPRVPGLGFATPNPEAPGAANQRSGLVRGVRNRPDLTAQLPGSHHFRPLRTPNLATTGRIDAGTALAIPSGMPPSFTSRRIEFRPLPGARAVARDRAPLVAPAYLGSNPRAALHRQARQRAVARQELLVAHRVARQDTLCAPDRDPDPSLASASERRSARWASLATVLLLVAICLVAAAFT